MSDPSSPSSSRYQSVNQTQVSSPIQPLKSLPSATLLADSVAHDEAPEADEDSARLELATQAGDEDETARRKSAAYMPSVVSKAVETVAGFGAATVQGIGKHSLRDHKLKAAVRNRADDDDNDLAAEMEADKGKGNALPPKRTQDEDNLRGESSVEDTQGLGQLEERMREDLQGVSLQDRDPGQEVREAARDKNSDVRSVLGGSQGLGRATSYDGSPGPEEFSLKPRPTGPLDLDGPKVSPDALGVDLASPPERSGGALTGEAT